MSCQHNRGFKNLGNTHIATEAGKTTRSIVCEVRCCDVCGLVQLVSTAMVVVEGKAT
jgi:hypothetical protein